MKILAIDTATTSSSIALLEDNTLLAEYTVYVKKNHSERLLPLIDHAFKTLSISLNEVDFLALTTGPGSFTGLRVGIATVKGLAWTLKKPMVSIPTLKAIAVNVQCTDKLICPVLDARKKEVYAAVYRYDKDILVTEKEVFLTTSSDLAAYLNKPTIFLGDGITNYRDVFKDALGNNAVFAPEALWHPKASNIGTLAFCEIKKGNVQRAWVVTPHYIRKTDAEFKIHPKNRL
ncbi:MAG: tRNA (adenosine(37)-N6)-threonylcarbamoyltransferase complex dimerization subunit type 1 TsaB [Deltaproteobacteria bacterium GWC2_42_11]|nr:MAG: tRNA (adenosine(37)-N6)-threonylcarbamoyltransferase complex dimerization subunit type 1 TsaB [Deltaproteobacteria bacterium GWC2_42_11]HBO84591.1 tRNA (adenosine(37)-N6)-threonylcarbamoyltransferase complex dimerization subunit type 1 TsaB [Deltaproteobacteria bacterium]